MSEAEAQLLQATCCHSWFSMNLGIGRVETVGRRELYVHICHKQVLQRQNNKYYVSIEKLSDLCGGDIAWVIVTYGINWFSNDITQIT